MHQSTIVAILSLVLLDASAATPTAETPATRPNVVILLTDDQGVTAARLYNLATDPGETKDLAATMPDKVKELQAKWDAWNAGNVKPLWGAGGGDSDGDEPAAAPRRKTGKQEN